MAKKVQNTMNTLAHQITQGLAKELRRWLSLGIDDREYAVWEKEMESTRITAEIRSHGNVYDRF